MKISVIHKTVENLGDHGREVSYAIEPKEGETVQEFAERILITITSGVPSFDIPDEITPHYSEHIEIRLIKEESK